MQVVAFRGPGRKRWGLATAMSGALLVGMAVPASAGPGQAVTLLRDVEGTPVGIAHASQRSRGTLEVWVQVWNLPAGFHGFHLHENGECAAPFQTAGGHYNPEGVNHPAHAGDLPVLYIKENETGFLAFETDRLTLQDIFDQNGSALIVHALPDNFVNIPARYDVEPDEQTSSTGDAGARIACGAFGGHRRH